MFNKTYDIRYGDYKDFDTVKVSSILDFAQDIAIKHSDSCGFGIHKLHDMSLAWMIHGLNIKILKPISTKHNLDVFTAIKNMKFATSDRGCILSQNGEEVAKVITTWFLFDFGAMKPTMITDEISSAYGLYDFKDDFFKYRKPEIISAEKIFDITVRNKDIDTNLHLNNQKSAEMLMTALPIDFDFTDVSILYKKAAYLNDELEVCIKKLENGYYVHLQTKQKEVCVAGTFTK